MIENWEMKKIGDVASVGAGNSAPQKKELFENGVYPFFRTSDAGRIKKGFIDYAADSLNDKGIKGMKLFEKGTILFPKSGASTFLNHRVVMGVSGYVSSHLATIKANNKLVEDKFIYYYLLTIDARDLMQDIAYPSLKLSDICLIPISIPSLRAQQRIVVVLDEAFTAIDKAKNNAEQNLKNTKEIYESYLQSLFKNKSGDWVKRRLGDIGKPLMCKRILKSQTSSTGEIPFYKIGTFGKKPNAFISKEIYNEFRTKYSFPQKGDILISASGTIGRRVRYDGEPAFFQDSNIVWIDNDEKQVLNDYLYVFYEFCDWQPSKGATIARLYNSNLTSIEIAFPKSLVEQNNILKNIDALSIKTKKLEAIYQKKICILEELKKSILRKAFNGKLKLS